jgi:hypothetical protein
MLRSVARGAFPEMSFRGIGLMDFRHGYVLAIYWSSARFSAFMSSKLSELPPSAGLFMSGA